MSTVNKYPENKFWKCLQQSLCLFSFYYDKDLIGFLTKKDAPSLQK